ncbi:MAG: hypothetical protein H6741_06240 [Alphaproteobacteria bacterium]|nr:hypothetical protein [Alphaproteobacteria bacterium]MCB9792309.1 hypothetical protein [Alphaproteobacteria bacterium]
MSRALTGLSVALLGLACLGQLGFALRTGPDHATLPIFVPASLKYERAMRSERSQPAALGGQEAELLANHLLQPGRDLGEDPRLAERIAAMKATRARILELRNQRHALNVANMNLGVELAQELTPAQWDHVQSNRDQLRAEAEFRSYDRLLEQVQGGGR